jgi:hypothetical protein
MARVNTFTMLECVFMSEAFFSKGTALSSDEREDNQ